MRQSRITALSNRGLRGWVGVTALLSAGVILSGCHIDMWNQSKMKPFYQSDFFPDQSADRPLVEHTVAVGPIQSADPGLYTGYINGKLIPTIPVRAVQSFESPKAMLLRGQNRFNAYCTPCHGKTGDGNGFIMQRGLGYWQKLAASYHTDRLRKTPDGHIYDVLTNGYGVMYAYGSRIQDVNDRWAIVSYVRALQLARTTSPVGAAGDTPMTPPGETPLVSADTTATPAAAPSAATGPAATSAPSLGALAPPPGAAPSSPAAPGATK
jgi:mono/diheme cytochrome c family protein